MNDSAVWVPGMQFRSMREVAEYLGSCVVLTLVMIRWVEGYSND